MRTLRLLSAILAVGGIPLILLPLTPLSANPLTDTVFVRMPADAYDAANLSHVRALDYDTFFWLELSAADFAALQASGLPYQVTADPFTLNLGGLRFDTRSGGSTLPDGWDSVGYDGPDLHLVQFIGPTRAEWLDRLRNSGIEVVQYIHPFTYVVWGEQKAIDRLAGTDYVHWTGPFAPAYRVLPPLRSLPDQPYVVNVLLYRGADTDAALYSIETLGGQVIARTKLNHVFEIAGLVLPGTRFQAAAQVPGVYSIQRQKTDGGLRGEMSNQINVNNHDANNLAFPGYLEWLASAGVDGNGVIIANVDGGVQDTHPDLVNRIVPCNGQTCGGGASSGHGTHTAGIMAADASSGVRDIYGFYRGLGMAPGANLVEQVYNPWFQQPGGMLLLMTDSYNNGASLSGNSWGPSGTPQGYDDDTMQVDIGVRDADPNAPGNQPLSYILSIMNGGGGYQTQGTPDEAKNIFTIGSTKMQNGDGSQILEINDLSANTAHGPCLDGRLIPHLVAPGCNVDSTVVGGHDLMCGTSMSSPHVSGAVALFIEYYRNLFGVDPTPALIKAAFLPVAHDLAGHLDADGNPLGHPFDNKQGWGRMDTAAVVSPTAAILYYDNPVIFDNTGEEWGGTLSVADPGKPVRLMLVWTDAPGHGLGGATPAWNNDLDLVVEAGGNTYYGNHFGTDGWSTPGGAADDRNNTEGVFLGPTANGSFTVRVIASNINSDGVPNYGDDTDQDLALVCWNCLEGADYTLSAEPDAFEVCTPEVVTSTIEVGQILSYSQPVDLVVLGVPAGTTAEITPTVVTPPGEALLTLDVGDTTASGEYTLVVSGTAEITRVHTTAIDLLVSTELPDAPTLISPPEGASNVPYEQVTFVWGLLPQVWNYGLQVDVRPDFSSPVVSITGIPTGTYTLDTPLEPATCYFWHASGENACGPGDWAAPFHFATIALEVVFDDDIESGDGQWTHQAAVGADHWEISNVQSHSPTHAWYVPDDAVVTDSWLRNLSSVSLTGGSTLTFWHRYDFEDAYDGGVIEISTDGGASWSDLGPHIAANGYNGTISTCCGNPLGGRQAWVQDLGAWTQVEIDLDAFVGQDALIRWRIGCDASVSAPGWYIDDVQVSAQLPPNPALILESITPDQGWFYEETPVQIIGSGFIGAPNARLGETWLLSPTLVSSTTLDAVVPAGMTPGIYDLTVINGDCQDDSLLGAFTVLGQCPTPTVELTSDSPVELGVPIHFTATIVTGTAPFTYTWDFGGPGHGSGLDGPNPVYTYTDYGAFTVTLTLSDACGTTAVSGTAEVLCYPPTGALSSDSPVELGRPMHFTATAVTGTAPLTYNWDMGGPGYGAGLGTPWAVFTYTAHGSFTVTLTLDNACGPTAVSDTVEVLCHAPTGGFTTNSPVMLGEAMAFTATVAGTAPLTYSWDLGDGVGWSDQATLAYTYTTSGVFRVTLTVGGPCGTTVFTDTVTVQPMSYEVYLPLVFRRFP